MRHRHSSSESSSSSSEEYTSKSKRNASSKHKKRRSRSRSDSSSPSRSKKSHRRRHRSTSSSSTSSSRSAKKYSKSKKPRSPSPLQMGPKPAKSNLQSVDELYKNEKTRQKEINKIQNDHESGGGFKPKTFKSSRSTKVQQDTSKEKRDLEHENAIFGSSKQPSLDKSEYVNITLGRAADSLINPSVLSTSNKSIMHENFYEDLQTREQRWKEKMIKLLEKTQE